MNGKERPLDIHRQIVELIDGGRSFAVGLVLKADGSTPQKAGAKAALDDTGKIWGTLGGGAVEAAAQRRVIEVCQARQPVVFDFTMDGAHAHDDRSICGGAMRLLLDPAVEKYRTCFVEVTEALQQRKKGVLITVIRDLTPTEVKVRWLAEEELSEDMSFPGEEKVRSCLKSETPALFIKEGTSEEVMVEPMAPQPLLIIAGGGHIGQAVAQQANLVGFEVLVLDDRSEFTGAALFPEAVRTRCGAISEVLAETTIGPDTYIVIVTRGHKHDAEVLKECMRAPAAYVGMIGSKRKVALIRKDFLESGITTEEEFNRVFTPIGLDIGAVTVPEIATSIVAQLVAVRRKGLPPASPGDMVLR